MSKLTQDKIDILDKLYNIKGEKSVVTSAIKSKIEQKEEEVETANKEKQAIVDQQEELERELQTFIEQTDKFLAMFSSFDNTSFSSLQSIGIDLNFGDTLSTLRQKAPSHEDNLETRVKGLKDQIRALEQKISGIEEKKSEFIKTLNVAEEAKEKLNDLIEDIIKNNNDSYPRKYVKDVLEGLSYFTKEEIATLEFLILFREEGLMEYDEGYELRGNKFEKELKSDKEVMLTGAIFAKEEEEEQESVVEEPKTTKLDLTPSNGALKPVTHEEERAVDAFKEKKEPVVEVEENNETIFAAETPISVEEIQEEVDATIGSESPTVEENEEVSPRQPLGNNEKTNEQTNPVSNELDKLTELGLDVSKINSDDSIKATELAKEVDKEIISQNYELLKSINISDETLYKVYNVEAEAK